MVTVKKKPAKKAAKKSVKQVGKKAAKKGSGRKAAAKKTAKSVVRQVNVGRLDLLWRELEKLSKEMRQQGLTAFADRVGDAQDVVKEVWQELIGGKGNGPDPGKMIFVAKPR